MRSTPLVMIDILSAFTPMPVEVAMGIMTFVLVVPVAIGGMKADVTTDIIAS